MRELALGIPQWNILIFLFHFSALATQGQAALPPWDQLERTGGTYAYSKELDLDVRLYLTGKKSKKVMQTGRLIRWDSPVNSKHPNIAILVYYSGRSKKLDIHRAVIVNTRSKRVIGDAPLEYISMNKALSAESPKWEWEKHTLNVQDPKYKQKLVFALE